MPFRSRLTTLLEYREYLLQQAQVELASARMRHEAAQVQLDRMQAEQDQQRRRLMERQSEGIAAGDFLLLQDYLNALERQLLRQMEECRSYSAEVEAARKNLMQREIELKMIQSLDRKELERYRKIQAGKELKELDEKAVLSGCSRKQDGLPL